MELDITEASEDREGPIQKPPTEKPDTWQRDAIDCIAEVIGQPDFQRLPYLRTRRC